MTAPPPAAVLWDMDGTLVDTEPYWIAAETPLVHRFGGQWSRERSLALVGLGLHDAARILQDAGVAMTADDIVQTLTSDVMAQLRRTGVPFRPGARAMLRGLRDQGVRTALVTMSLRRMADAIVALLGFDAFDVVIAGDEVDRPKPHPDPYLRACRRLGVDPRETVAIEDSPNGVRAALAAGATTLGVPLLVPLHSTGAHALWASLEGHSPADLAAIHARRVSATALRAAP
jgi:HAD superfamily hydrolase (TIGR01509 family)